MFSSPCCHIKKNGSPVQFCFLISSGLSILFLIAGTPFYILTNYVQGFQFLHLLTHTCYPAIPVLAVYPKIWKQGLKESSAHPWSYQHCSQQPRGESNQEEGLQGCISTWALRWIGDEGAGVGKMTPRWGGFHCPFPGTQSLPPLWC